MDNKYLEYGNKGVDSHNNEWERISIGKVQDLTGQRFNHLIALFPVKEVDKNTKRPTAWLCLCDCGNLTVTRASSLKNNHTKSCG